MVFPYRVDEKDKNSYGSTFRALGAEVSISLHGACHQCPEASVFHVKQKLLESEKVFWF